MILKNTLARFSTAASMLLLLIASPPSCSGDLLFDMTFEVPALADGGGFGSAVGISESGTVLAIGSPIEADVGQVNIFDRTTGELIRTLDPPSPTDFRLFGSSLDISSDGATIIIGAPWHDSATNGGQAYLFAIETGDLLQTFDLPDDGSGLISGGGFGSAVSLDGGRVLIGAETASNAGRSYLFDLTNGDLLQTFEDPTPTLFGLNAGGDFFGSTVKLCQNMVVIGAPYHAGDLGFQGEVHVFNATTGELQFTIDSPIPDPGLFGDSLDATANLIAVGAPAGGNPTGFGRGQVHLFEAQTGAFVRTLSDPDSFTFGTSVALSGNQVLIGADRTNNLANNDGQAYLFNATTGELLQTFSDPNPNDNDYFGSAVDLNYGFALIGSGKTFTTAVDPPLQAHSFSIQFPLGDINRDNTVDFFDITPFVEVLASGTYQCEADMNTDGKVNFLDIAPLIIFISGG